jgi:hypothetical protein
LTLISSLHPGCRQSCPVALATALLARARHSLQLTAGNTACSTLPAVLKPRPPRALHARAFVHSCSPLHGVSQSCCAAGVRQVRYAACVRSQRIWCRHLQCSLANSRERNGASLMILPSILRKDAVLLDPDWFVHFMIFFSKSILECRRVVCVSVRNHCSAYCPRPPV